MTIVADESVAAAILERLRQDGLTVQAVRDFAPATTDKVILETADKANVLLLTEDKDFGEMVYRQNASHHGVVLIRLAGLSRALRAALVSEAIKLHAAEFLGAFTVVAPGGIRIRPAPSPGDTTSSNPEQ
jgi:predicted nuclease of predicted toxin-antitoxin system